MQQLRAGVLRRLLLLFRHRAQETNLQTRHCVHGTKPSAASVLCFIHFITTRARLLQGCYSALSSARHAMGTAVADKRGIQDDYILVS